MNATKLPFHTDATRPEPLDWHPPPSAWQRIRRAAAVPFTAAAAVFAAIVLISIVTVWAAPHTPSLADDGGELASSGTGASGGRGALTLGEEPAGDDAPPDAGASPSVSTSAPAAERPGGTGLCVHVVGEVHAPGLYQLADGTRIADAIEAAGGATDAAVLSFVNLARPLVDGEQIVVPGAEGVQAQASSQAGGGAASGTGALVNLNSADLAGLDTLPGVGPALAQRILDWRAANGRFTSTEQLLDISGIGQKVFERLRERVTV